MTNNVFGKEMERNRTKKSMSDSSEVYAIFGNTPYYLRPQSGQIQTRSLMPEKQKNPDNELKSQKLNATTLDQKWQHFLQVKALRASGQNPPRETFPEKENFSKSQPIPKVKQPFEEKTNPPISPNNQFNTTTIRPHVTFSQDVMANVTHRRRNRY